MVQQHWRQERSRRYKTRRKVEKKPLPCMEYEYTYRKKPGAKGDKRKNT